ncbi:MAG: hypothetical protein ACFCD0_04125 [Gemmataceae bacterium]
MSSTIPIVLFTYARPRHLASVLEHLKANNVPRICAYSDAPKHESKTEAVQAVRKLLRGVDWCDIEIVERTENYGLGRSILSGLQEVFSRYEAAIIFEDDLICVPGAYNYLCEALRHYHDDFRVMSVTGWTHPKVTPSSVTDQPYFDGRAECWVWGTWKRAWSGMETDALTLLQKCEARKIDVAAYGIDLIRMAHTEREKNIWAVRLILHHLLQGGLCIRPPWSMVEHIGFDQEATNASDSGDWAAPPLRACPPVPLTWPIPVLHSECSRLWSQKYPAPQSTSFFRRAISRAKYYFFSAARRVLPQF